MSFREFSASQDASNEPKPDAQPKPAQPDKPGNDTEKDPTVAVPPSKS